MVCVNICIPFFLYIKLKKDRHTRHFNQSLGKVHHLSRTNPSFLILIGGKNYETQID